MSCTEWVQTHTNMIQTMIQMVVKWLEVHSMENVTYVARKDTEPTNVLRRNLEGDKAEKASMAEVTPKVEVVMAIPRQSLMELATTVESGAI